MRTYFFIFLFFTTLIAKDSKAINFDNELINSQANDFTVMVGRWHIDKDSDGNIVYAVDGRRQKFSSSSNSIIDKAKALYKEKYAEFLDFVRSFNYFPLSIYKHIKNFSNGTISMRFKGVSGRVDQGAGIAFNIKQNGDYLVVRANPLENNLVLFKLKDGKRSSVKWIRGVNTPSKVWHTIKVTIKNKTIKAYINDKLYLEYTHTEPISGRVGLWSKADSYVFFDDIVFLSQ